MAKRLEPWLPAAFLDRDGVLVRLVRRDGRWVAPRRIEEFALLPGAAAAVEALRCAGLPVVVVTNQPDLARGTLSPAVLDEMHRRLAAQLALDAIYTCPHDDGDGCACRKPRPGLLVRASLELGIALGQSFLVGDSWRDIEAGHAAGCRTIALPEAGPPAPAGGPRADFRAADLRAAAAMILRELRRRHRRGVLHLRPLVHRRPVSAAPSLGVWSR